MATRHIHNEEYPENRAKSARAKAGATGKKRKNDGKSEEKKKTAAAANPGSAELRPQRVRTQTKHADETVSF